MKIFKDPINEIPPICEDTIFHKIILVHSKFSIHTSLSYVISDGAFQLRGISCHGYKIEGPVTWNPYIANTVLGLLINKIRQNGRRSSHVFYVIEDECEIDNLLFNILGLSNKDRHILKFREDLITLWKKLPNIPIPDTEG